MAIDIEEIKQIPEKVKPVIDMVTPGVEKTKEVVVQDAKPFFDWKYVVHKFDGIDSSTLVFIFLAIIFIRPIFTIVQYAIALGLIYYVVSYFAFS